MLRSIVYRLSLLLAFQAVSAPGSTVAAANSSHCSEPDLTKLPSFPTKPRVFILSDILNEPDDSMSFVRYLLYTNELQTRGIVATTGTFLREINATHPEEMRRIVRAFGETTDNLNRHVHPDSKYPSADELLPLVSQGATVSSILIVLINYEPR